MQVSLFTKVLVDRDVDEAIARAADLGYDGVELMGRAPHLPPETPVERAEELKALLDDRGVEVPCLATYTGDYVGTTEAEDREELQHLERFLELAAVFDCDVVRHGPNGPKPYEATDDQFEEAAAGMRRAADLAAEYGKTLGVEIHGNKLAETADSTLRLLDLVDRDNVGAIFDTGNMYLVGTDYGRDAVAKLGDRLVHAHVKDERRVDDPDRPGAFEFRRESGPLTFQPARMGEGDVDHRTAIEALAEAGYDGHVTAECHVPQEEPGDDVAVAEHELAALRTLVDEAERR